MATSYLNRTLGTVSSTTVQTLSVWIKPLENAHHSGNIGVGEGYGALVTGQYDSGSGGAGYWHGGGASTEFSRLSFWSNNGSGNAETEPYVQVEDSSAWTHIVYSVNLGASGNDKLKIYVNGELMTEYVADERSNYTTLSNWWDTGKTIQIGRKFTDADSLYFHGNMAQLHLCDGYNYAASDFGETDSTTGIWKPKINPSVNYGNEGFFLKFSNSSDLGEDFSGNNNDFTNSSVISTVDNPKNNFATLFCDHRMIDTDADSVTDTILVPTLSNAGLSALNPNGSLGSAAVSSYGMNAGKWYMEIKAGANMSNQARYGVSIHERDAHDAFYMSTVTGYWYDADGTLVTGPGNTTASYGNSFTTNDIIQIAYDADNGTLWFGKNGTWQNSATQSEIEAGTTTNAAVSGLSTSDTWHFSFLDLNNGEYHVNFGNGYFGTTAVSSGVTDDSTLGTFEYTPPSGFYSLCSKNINTYG